MKQFALKIHLQNATAFMAKYCIECQEQKPMRENGIKITSYNGMEAKKTEKWGDEENGTAINMIKAFRIQAIFGARVED